MAENSIFEGGGGRESRFEGGEGGGEIMAALTQRRHPGLTLLRKCTR